MPGDRDGQCGAVFTLNTGGKGNSNRLAGIEVRGGVEGDGAAAAGVAAGNLTGDSPINVEGVLINGSAVDGGAKLNLDVRCLDNIQGVSGRSPGGDRYRASQPIAIAYSRFNPVPQA